MNAAEFQQWFENHCRFFPGVAAWLSRLPPPATAEGVLAAWQEVLAQYPLEAAREATRRMATGLLEVPLRAERHVYAVRDWCRSQQSQPARPKRHFAPGGEETFACPICEDYGTVLVVHPEVVAKLRRGEEIRFPYEVAVACRCPAGDRWGREELGPRRLARLKLHHLVVPPGKDARRVLVEEGLLEPHWPKPSHATGNLRLVPQQEEPSQAEIEEVF